MLKNKFLQLPMRVWDPLGTERIFSTAEAIKATGKPRTMVFLGLNCLLLAATDPANHSANLQHPYVMFIWIVLTIVFVSSKVLVNLAATLFQTYVWRARVPIPITTLVALGPVMLVSESMAAYLSDDTFVSQFWQQFVIFYVIAVLLEILFFLFVLPTLGRNYVDPTSGEPVPLDQEITAALTAATLPPEPQSPLIVIGAERVPLSDIQTIEAQEHHVIVTTTDRTFTERARLKDIIAQTTPKDGIQPHRSWWVSNSVTCDLVKQQSRHLLRLDDKREIPVARSRVAEIIDWVNCEDRQNRPDEMAISPQDCPEQESPLTGQRQPNEAPDAHRQTPEENIH